MSGASCRVLALPGGNPAPLVTLAWALRRDGVRVREIHAVLYASAQRWLHAELLGGAEPLAQLRALTNDASLATIVEHPALRHGALVEDDAAPEDAVAYMDTAWQAARARIGKTNPPCPHPRTCPSPPAAPPPVLSGYG